MVVRIFMSMFCVTIMIVSIAHGADSTWLIYLTNWSYILLTTTMIGLTLISISHVRKKKYESETNRQREEYVMTNTSTADAQVRVVQRADIEIDLHLEGDRNMSAAPSLVWYEKIVWLLWIVASNAAFIVTIEYWSIVFRPPTSFMDISVHALNSVFILTELFTGKIPVRILHWIYVMIFSAAYTLFTVIYWAAGGVNGRGDPFIYEILNYEYGKPGVIAAVLIGTIFFLSPLVQFILYGLHRAGVWLDKNKTSNNNNVNNIIS